MRKLMWFVIGFSASCFLQAYFVPSDWMLLLVLISVCGIISVAFTKLRTRLLLITLLIGLTVGSVWSWGYHELYLAHVKPYDGKTVDAVATVQDYSNTTQYGAVADAKLMLDGHSFQTRVYCETAESLNPGDQIKGEFRIRMTTKDSLKGETYHQGQGIMLLSYANKGSVVLPADRVSAKYFAPWLRLQITQKLDEVFPADTLAFARALLLGDSSLMSYKDDSAFKISGIRHVIAVSGLHVSILLSLVYIFTVRRRLLTVLLGLPVLFVFAAVAGFTPSVVRACIMHGLIIIASAVKEEYDPPTALSFSVLIMLLMNPMVITAVGFQLSVGCLVGILLFYEKIYQYLYGKFKLPKGKSKKKRFCSGLCGSVSITVSTTIITTPLSAFYFGTVSLVSVITNLLTLWVVSFVFYGIMLACVLGAIWAPAGKIVAWIISWPIRYIIAVANLMADFPLSAVYTCSVYIVVWLVMCYALLAVFMGSKKKHPAFMTGCVSAGLLLALVFSWVEPRLDDSRLTVLDVGQGQAIILQHAGQTVLVDCGGDTATIAADAVANMLHCQGIFSLDAAILTHYDQDHAAGLELLLTRITVDNLYLPDIADDGATKASLLSSYKNSVCVSQKVILPEMEGAITLIPADDPDQFNESSMCVLFQSEKCDILITGDRGVSGERELLEKVQLPKLDLLVVGHHGSRNSASYDLLETTRPAHAVISVGKQNNFGHPSEDVLRRLRLVGASVWRTDENGTVIFRR